MLISHLKTSNGLLFSLIGPSLDKGPLSTLFYFALSAHENFSIDPYNQIVKYFKTDHVRILTLDLPGHGKGLASEKALTLWAKKMAEGEDILTPFFEKVKKGIDELCEDNLIERGKLGVIGLSRGAFIACHIAAICPQIEYILGFAPLTSLSYAREFKSKDVCSFNLETLFLFLYRKKIRFYIGNQDTRVGTDHCFNWIYQLAKFAKQHHIYSPPFELIMSPSIGYLGHGTPPYIFKAGATWIKQIMDIEHAPPNN